MFYRVAAVSFAALLFISPIRLGNLVGVLLQAQVVTAAAATKEQVPSEVDDLFGLATEPVLVGSILTRWSGAEAGIRADNQILALCRVGGSCPEAARRFLAIVDQGRAHDGRARIGVINRAINLAITPMDDLTQWGVPDRWSPPLETFTTGHGDCEDYAIAKYVALKAAGVDEVKLVVARNIIARENHAAVAVRLDGRWLILDNRSLALIADSEWRSELPLFVLDENGVRRFILPDKLFTKLTQILKIFKTS
jgi:predicted transglutaminase-like cysteine proteinase